MSIQPPPLPELELRLHPMSWLFVLISYLRHGLFPLVTLLFFGQRGDHPGSRWQSYAFLIVALGMVISALVHYVTFRYHIGKDRLSVRSGLFERSRREIPFARIHNVVVRQNLLHRVFGVADLILESAGSPKPEAEMRVLPLAQALALEQLVRQRGPSTAPTITATDNPPQTTPSITDTIVLFSLKARDLLRIGLVSNRGMVVVAAAMGIAFQLFPEDAFESFLNHHGDQAVEMAREAAFSTGTWVVLASSFVLAVMIATRLLSVALAFVQYYGFQLRRDEQRLSLERGLFSRTRSNLNQQRIQAWRLYEALLPRWLGHRQLKVDIAAGAVQSGKENALRELAPLASRADCQRLLATLAPQLPDIDTIDWQQPANNQRWRLFLPGIVICAILLGIGVTTLPGYWPLCSLVPLPLFVIAAWRESRFMGWHLSGNSALIRGGSWKRWWMLAPLRNVHGLRLSRSPMDQLCGTASLLLDTAGNTLGEPRLRLRFVPLELAQHLLRQLNLAASRPAAAESALGNLPLTSPPAPSNRSDDES